MHEELFMKTLVQIQRKNQGRNEMTYLETGIVILRC